MRKFMLVILLVSLVGICCSKKEKLDMDRSRNLDLVQAKLAHFTLVVLTVDRSSLDENQLKVIKLLVKAAAEIDQIFWQQTYTKASAIKNELAKSNNPLDQAYLHLLTINYGPFDRLDGDHPFIGKAERPPGANFYPEDLTRQQVIDYVQQHPQVKEAFYKLNTLIKRQENELIAVPYEQEYRSHLSAAAGYLKDAAKLTTDEAFKKYLNLRADALLSGDFFESDMAWMDLQNNPVDIVIGPIETYEDQLLGLKAAYESMVLVQDRAETEKLERYQKFMNQLEASLPVPGVYKRNKVAPPAPIGVFNTVYTAADANVAVKSIAFSLPNDERVRTLKGARTVQQKNVILAKFAQILIPISQHVMAPELQSSVDGEAFFTNTLLHELAHPLGLDYVKDKNGVTIREALRETYSAIEEAKADVVGLYNVGFYVRAGVLPAEFEPKAYATFLASIFRSVRFGTTEAHAKANMIAFNYLAQAQAVTYDSVSGRYHMDFLLMKNTIKKLAADLLMIEGDGDYLKAQQWLRELAIIPPEMEQILSSLTVIPVDLEFQFDPILFD